MLIANLFYLLLALVPIHKVTEKGFYPGVLLNST